MARSRGWLCLVTAICIGADPTSTTPPKDGARGLQRFQQRRARAAAFALPMPRPLPLLGTTSHTGVIYAAVGIAALQDALYSGSKLGADANVTVFGDPATTLLCAEKVISPHWQCLDAISLLNRSQCFGCESCARLVAHTRWSTARSSKYSSGLPSGGLNRLVKLGSLLLAPYQNTFFFDADVVPCMSLGQLLRLMDAPRRSSSIWDAADLLAATNHMYNDKARTGRWAAHEKLGGTPMAWPYLNSGVILFRSDREPVQVALLQWLCSYCDDAQKGVPPGEDQPYLNAALYQGVRLHHLRVTALPPIWNPRRWEMRMPKITNHSAGCCKGSAYLDHGCQKPRRPEAK